MIYKTPTIADAIIVTALSSIIGFFSYLSVRFTSTSANPELSKLEEELQVERLKMSISQFKDNAIRDKALKDARASLTGTHTGKEVMF